MINNANYYLFTYIGIQVIHKEQQTAKIQLKTSCFKKLKVKFMYSCFSWIQRYELSIINRAMKRQISLIIFLFRCHAKNIKLRLKEVNKKETRIF